MRTKACALVTLTVLCAACSMPGTANESAAAKGGEAETPTLAISATGPANCTASWNGEPVTRDALTDRGVAVLEQAIAAIGGVANLTQENLPTIRVEGAGAVPWSCAGSMLGALQRAGVPQIALKASDADQPIELRASFYLLGVNSPPPSSIVRVEQGGRLTWNGEPADLAAVRARAAQSSAFVPGELLIVPSSDTTLGAVYETVRAVRMAEREATLPGCRAGPRPENAPEPPEAEAGAC